MEILKHFKESLIFTILALILGIIWAHHMNPGLELSAIFVVIVLSILEISLSFDNAVINAGKLEKMSPVWQHRFLTWGIFIAVFGMRFLFPLLVVSIFSNHSMKNVLDMAINNSKQYSYYLHMSHPAIITFGGCFLIMLFFNYFFNQDKKIDWIKPLESKMRFVGKVKGIDTILTLLILYFQSYFIPSNNRFEVIIAGLWGIIIYLLVEGISSALENYSKDKNETCTPHFNLANHCFINFLYLELIDASFSLDGVLGAFALSKDVVIITIGLAIGAMFVRSLTILLVEKKTLKQFIYLEHGAHFAIGALAILMLVSSFKEISEIITGLIGLVFIVAALISSVKEKNN